MKLTITLLIAFISYTLPTLAQTKVAEKESATRQDAAPKPTPRLYKGVYGKWFYMPSFSIDFASAGEKNVNLYTEYANQYKNVDPVYVIPQNMIKFHAIGFDETIFEVAPTIDASHVMKYKIKTGIVKESKSAYITIIGVIQ